MMLMWTLATGDAESYLLRYTTRYASPCGRSQPGYLLAQHHSHLLHHLDSNITDPFKHLTGQDFTRLLSKLSR